MDKVATSHFPATCASTSRTCRFTAAALNPDAALSTHRGPPFEQKLLAKRSAPPMCTIDGALFYLFILIRIANDSNSKHTAL